MHTRFFVILLSLIFGGIRLYGVKDPAFQALAHLWVGMLQGAWVTLIYMRQKLERSVWNQDALEVATRSWWLGLTWGGLSVLELVCFLAGR